MQKRDWALAGWALVLTAASLLLISKTPPLVRSAGLVGPGPTTPAPDAVVALAAAAAAWLILGWICLGLALSLAEVAAERAGSRVWSPLATTARWLAPADLRRVLRTSLQLSLVASSAGAVLVAAPAAVHADAGEPRRWPSVDRLAVDRFAVDRRDAPARPEIKPAATYRVRPGDTLWDIAAAHLPAGADAAAIASAWPQWWSVNRRVIGSDPDLIRPGQLLRAPAGSSGGVA